MKTLLSTFQWVVFILAGTIVAPIVIGEAFQLTQPEISLFLQRTLFVVGIAGLLQAMFGHKLPLTEGPAGLWWGIFIVYAGLAASGGIGTIDGLRQLEAAMLVSGVFFVVIGLFKWVHIFRKLFTPLVTGTYLILLVAQLSGSFIQGILGVGYLSNTVDAKVAVPAIIVLIIAIVLSRIKSVWIRSYSVLISLVIGWLIFSVLGITKEGTETNGIVRLPEMLPFGVPEWNSGIIITAIVTGLLLLTNMIASVSVVQNVIERYKQLHKIDYNKSSFIMGLNQGLGGLFGAVGPVPISGTAGFLLTTQIVERLPFILANVMLVIVSLFPGVTSIASNLPTPVGYAVVFLPIASLIGLGLKEYKKLELNERELFIIAVSFMIGIGSLFVPAAALIHLPKFLMTIANNGLILGTITCIALERIAVKRLNR